MSTLDNIDIDTGSQQQERRWSSREQRIAIFGIANGDKYLSNFLFCEI